MAEWTGSKRPTQRSQPAELDVRSERMTIPVLPEAPGAIGSPQLPGMTPDRNGLPTQDVKVMPRATTKRRPLSQLGTAQEIIKVYRPTGPDGSWLPADFEQADSSVEEVRKVDPRLIRPNRPAPGYETHRALSLMEERSLALAAAMEGGALESGLPMNAVVVTSGEIAAIPTEATLLGMAGAAAGSVTLGSVATGIDAGGAPVTPKWERAGSLTGLGAPAGAVAGAAYALSGTPTADADAHPAASTRDALTDAAPKLSEFIGGMADGADMGADLQPGFTTGGAAREGGAGGWLVQEEQIEGIVAGHEAKVHD
ncbi:MAG: hypothetical protein ACR2J8_04580, partial [Thermomicrobiales bacterium]